MNKLFAGAAIALIGAMSIFGGANAGDQPQWPHQSGMYVYASLDCKVGCAEYESNSYSGNPTTIFSGSNAKTYRVCKIRNSGWSSTTINVDSRSVNIDNCADVNGKVIMLTGKANIGRLPE